MDELLISQVKSIIDENIPLISNLSNVSSILKDGIKGTSWAGFYLTSSEKNSLYLGPFQGKVACTIIPFDKGVCGKCAATKEIQLVPDVNKFKGHIACSSTSRSEVVVPLIKDGKCVGVIDLDSDDYDNFTEDDCLTLESIAKLLEKLF